MSLFLWKIAGIIQGDELSSFISVDVFPNTASNGNSTTKIGTINLKFDPDTESIVILAAAGQVNDGVKKTLHLQGTSTDAKVPTGKKWKGYLLFNTTTGGSGDFDVQASDTADDSDGTKLKDYNIGANLVNYFTTELLEFAAGKYVTLVSDTGNPIPAGGIFIESDA